MTDTECKLILAELLPRKVVISEANVPHWKSKPNGYFKADPILDTEWLAVCWDIEQALNEQERLKYDQVLYDITYGTCKQYSANWQTRAKALFQIKNLKKS